MKTSDLNKLLDPTLYQVFLLKSAVPVPLNFAMHGWFVINLKGDVHRWEFGKWGKMGVNRYIDVVHNYMPATVGMNKYGWMLEPRTPSKLLHYIEGKEDSLAHNMACFINEHSNDYPLKNVYRYTGPNSNTYLQWVINHFPEAGFKLPCNAFGKNYNIRKKVSLSPDT